MKKVRLVKRHYWNKRGDHASYRNVVHREDDEPMDDDHPYAFLLDDFEDGAIVEVTLKQVGRVKGRWQLTSPHTYTKVASC